MMFFPRRLRIMSSIASASASSCAVTISSSIDRPKYPSTLQEKIETYLPLVDVSSLKSDHKQLTQLLSNYLRLFSKLPFDPKVDFGYMEKKDLTQKTRIFTRADIHGNLKCLLETLKELQSQKILDPDY